MKVDHVEKCYVGLHIISQIYSNFFYGGVIMYFSNVSNLARYVSFDHVCHVELAFLVP